MRIGRPEGSLDGWSFTQGHPEEYLKMRISALAGKGPRVLYRTARWVLGTLVVLILVMLVLSFYGQYRVMQFIEPGMMQAEVVAGLGEPGMVLEELGICLNGSWLGDCEAALQSGAIRYLVWKYGIDTCLVVGIDGESRVVFHDIGDA